MSKDYHEIGQETSLAVFNKRTILYVFTKRWRTIVLIGVIFVVVAGAFSLFQRQVNPSYQSEVAVLLTGAKYKLDFETKIVDAGGLAGGQQNAAQRLQEYKTIAESREVRRAAALLVSEDVPSGEVDLNKVDVRVNGALFRLSVTSNDPNRAARIAGAYAQVLAQRMDIVYGTTDQGTLEQLVKDAVTRHNAADEALAVYTSGNTIQSIQRVLDQREGVKAAIVGEINTTLSRRISFFNYAIAEIDRLRRDVESLRTQVTDAGQSPASRAAQALALLNLESRLITIGSGNLEPRPVAIGLGPAEALKDTRGSGGQRSDTRGSGGQRSDTRGSGGQRSQSVQLRLNLDRILGRDASKEQVLSDVETLVRSIDRRQSEVRQEYTQAVNDLNKQIASGDQALFADGIRSSNEVTLRLIDLLTAETMQSEAVLLRQKGELANLQRNVEQTKLTRVALEGKLQESYVSSAVSGGRAIVAASPTVPRSPAFPPPLFLTLPIAGLVGVMLGLGVALALEFRKGIRPQQIGLLRREPQVSLEPSLIDK